MTRTAPNKLTLEDYARRGAEIHGPIYHYEKLYREDNKTFLTIVCGKHGVFEQQAYVHTKSKSGCPACALEKLGHSPRYTLETYTEVARKVHGDKVHLPRAGEER